MVANRTGISAAVLALMTALPGAASAESKTWSHVADAGAVGVPLAAGIYTLYLDDREGSLELLWSWGAAVGATTVLKKTVDSTRPDGGDESFPSRHAASAFAGASFIHYRYGFRKAVPAYLAAGLVGYARVEDDKHHWEDVIGGAVVANASAWLLTSRYAPPVPVAVTWDPAEDRWGIGTAFRF